jgi:hypothetical protein
VVKGVVEVGDHPARVAARVGEEGSRARAQGRAGRQELGLDRVFSTLRRRLRMARRCWSTRTGSS